MKNTTLCYIEKDGKYLMMHRIKKDKDENRDKWIGIGGKIENGESPHECIRREILEETGLTVTNPEYRGLITFISNEFEQLCSKNEVLRERIENHVRAHKTHMKLLEETTVEKQI